MRNTEGTLVLDTVKRVGFWQFSLASGDYVGIVEQEPGEDEVLTVLARTTAGWKERRRVALGHAARASVIRLDGEQLHVCLEVNRGKALALGGWRAPDLVDPGVKEVRLSPGASLGLSADQAAGVVLPVGRLWNVADVLAPESWLFSPSFVLGAAPLQIIANTADGRAVTLPADGRPAGSGEGSIPDAQEPQAFVSQGKRSVVFKRLPQPAYPFWTLPRYGGRPLPEPGALLVEEGGGETTNLSATLGVGPVVAFSVGMGAQGVPWIFAARVALVGFEVVAIARVGTRWVVKGTRALDGEPLALDVARAHAGWSIVYAIQWKEGASVRSSLWEPGDAR